MSKEYFIMMYEVQVNQIYDRFKVVRFQVEAENIEDAEEQFIEYLEKLLDGQEEYFVKEA
jgi:hypothetical protein